MIFWWNKDKFIPSVPIKLFSRTNHAITVHSLFQKMVSDWSKMPLIMPRYLFDCVLQPRFCLQSMLCFIHLIFLLQSISDISRSCKTFQSCKTHVTECFFPILMPGSLFGVISFSDPLCWCCWQFSSVYILSAYRSPMEGNWFFPLFSILWRR